MNLIKNLPLIVIFIFNIFNFSIYSADYSFELEFLFENKSHQNPWQMNEPIRHRTNAIQISNNRYFALGLAKEIPIQNEVLATSGASIWRLRIIKYDSSTGFSLLESMDSKFNNKGIGFKFPKKNSECKFSEPRYVQLSFSPIPIKAFKKNNLLPRTEYIIQNNVFCGISIGQYIIPSEYIEFFINSKHINPFPHPGFEFESSLNSSERSFYFPNNRKGILVTKVYPGVGPYQSLIPGDAIYAINGVSLDKFSDDVLGDRVLDLILRKNSQINPIHAPVQLSFRRMGQDRTIRYLLKPYSESQFLVPENHPNKNPPYLITGGLLFTELTGSYLKEFGEDYRNKVDTKLLYLYENFQNYRYPHRERIVILSKVFPHNLNEGYHNFQDLVLESINGRKVRDIYDLKNFIQQSKEEYFVFLFSENKRIILSKTISNRIDFDLIGNFKIKNMDNLTPQ